MAKQSNYNVGIYVRLSKDDERSGESLSIKNQKEILNDYVSKQDNWNLYDIYIDDGFSGTSFNRPEIQRLLDDAKSGKYKTNYPPYGYIKGTDKNCTPIVDPYSAEIIRRIYETRASGMNVKKIAETLNNEKILVPSDYYYKHQGKPNPYFTEHLWSAGMVKRLLKNPVYLGDLIQLRTTTVSYKNHKVVKKDESEWAVIENNHEPIISQELWDRVREIDNSVSNGKSTKNGVVLPLSGLCYCADCGAKMKQNGTHNCKSKPSYTCSRYSRYGKQYCKSHSIRTDALEQLVLADIQHRIDFVDIDEQDARQKLLVQKMGMYEVQSTSDKKRQREIEKRIDELKKLMQLLFEDRVLGKMPEKTCTLMIEKYQTELDELELEFADLNKRTYMELECEREVDEFIRRLKSYAGAEKLTREMALELIKYITIDENPRNFKAVRKINVYYKLIDKKLNDKRNALA